MKKSIFALLVIVFVLSLALSACGGSHAIGGAPNGSIVTAGAQKVIEQTQNAVTTCKNAGDVVAMMTNCVDALEQVGQ